MNTYKFISAFIPLLIVTIHAIIQVYGIGSVLNDAMLKFVLLGLFVFGIFVYIRPYNGIVMLIGSILLMLLGTFLTMPETFHQPALEYFRSVGTIATIAIRDWFK